MAEKVQEKVDQDDLEELAKLGMALASKAGSAMEQEKIKDDILRKIGSLDQDVAKRLFRDERIQRLVEIASDDQAQRGEEPPGFIKDGYIGSTPVHGFVKKEWTEADLRARRDSAGKFITFIPHETIPVFWNGLRRQLIADEEVTIERCFYDVYQEHRRLTKVAKEHAEYLYRKRDSLSEPGVVGESSARARGMAEVGWYSPGGGSILEAATGPGTPQPVGGEAPQAPTTTQGNEE